MKHLWARSQSTHLKCLKQGPSQSKFSTNIIIIIINITQIGLYNEEPTHLLLTFSAIVSARDLLLFQDEICSKMTSREVDTSIQFSGQFPNKIKHYCFSMILCKKQQSKFQGRVGKTLVKWGFRENGEKTEMVPGPTVYPPPSLWPQSPFPEAYCCDSTWGIYPGGSGLVIQTNGTQVSSQPHASCLMLGQLFNLSKLKFSNL